jgi:hypothetical protein
MTDQPTTLVDWFRLVALIALSCLLAYLINFWLEAHGYIIDGQSGKEYWFEPYARCWVNDNICFWRW